MWLSRWMDAIEGNLLVVVEDNPTPSPQIATLLEAVPARTIHLSWQDLDAFGENGWIFSRRDSAIRSAGFLAAYNAGSRLILTLDDDCYPVGCPKAFLEAHKASLDAPRWTISTTSRRTRGIPYVDRGVGELPVHINMGGWVGVPDVDAIQSLSGDTAEIREWQSKVIPRDQYFPMCGMNLLFRREATPLMLFPMQGLDPKGKPWGFGRFDDIWSGLVAKKVADHLGWNVSCGLPVILHSRASDPFVNLVKEAPGVPVNEWLWRAVDGVQLAAVEPAAAVIELGEGLKAHKHEYVRHLGSALTIWGGLFR